MSIFLLIGLEVRLNEIKLLSWNSLHEHGLFENAKFPSEGNVNII